MIDQSQGRFKHLMRRKNFINIQSSEFVDKGSISSLGLDFRIDFAPLIVQLFLKDKH